MKQLVLLLLVIVLCLLIINSNVFSEEVIEIPLASLNAGCIYQFDATINNKKAVIPLSINITGGVENGEYRFITKDECQKQLVIPKGFTVGEWLPKDTDLWDNHLVFTAIAGVANDGWEAIIFRSTIKANGISYEAIVFVPASYYVGDTVVSILQETNVVMSILQRRLLTTDEPVVLRYMGYIPAEQGWTKPGLPPEMKQ